MDACVSAPENNSTEEDGEELLSFNSQDKEFPSRKPACGAFLRDYAVQMWRHKRTNILRIGGMNEKTDMGGGLKT